MTILRDVLIPTRDGTRIAANVYLPLADGSGSPGAPAPAPAPALVQYTPYLKDGLGGRGLTDVVQRFFARQGFAAVTLDIRGYGASEGTPAPPFALQEALDGEDVLEWIARQPWCDGTTGMWGVSWGGNSALAVAARRPPSLRAIVPIHAIDDEFTGAAWPHGCRGLLVGELDWGFRCVGLQLLPPLRFTDADWRARWLARLEGLTQPFPFAWHEIPPSTWATWRTPIEAIAVPTFAVSAFHDSYPRETVAYHERLTVPRRLLLGPWKHEHPDFAVHSPVGFATEMARWFDHWTRGRGGQAPLDPPVAWFEQPSGGWRAAAAWPPAGETHVEWYAAEEGVLRPDGPTSAGRDTYVVDPTVGLAALPWDWTTPTPPVPPDISPDDHRALTWTSQPVPADLLLCGDPELVIHLASDVPDLPLRAWLSDVAPSGSSTLISQGWARPLHVTGSPFAPGEPVEVRVPLNPTSYRVPAGHALRLAVAGSHFPALVPAPRNAALTVHRSPERPTRVRLPVVDPTAVAGAALAPTAFGAPIAERPRDQVNETTNEVRRSLDDRLGAYELRKRSSARLECGALLTWLQDGTVEVPRDRPRAFSMRGSQVWRVAPGEPGPDGEPPRPREPIELRLTAEQSFERFVITAAAEIGGVRVFERTWETDLARSDWRILE